MMKKWVLIRFVFVAILATLFVPFAVYADSRAPVLLIAREKSEDMEFWLTKEVAPMIKLLNDAGYEVVVADQSGKSIVAGNAKLVVHLKLAEVRAEEYAGIVVPCIGAGTMAGNSPELGVVLLREADAAGKPIAAQHAIEMLSPAGLYTKRNVANKPGVVLDRNLITSYNCPYNSNSNGKPVDTSELIARFVEALEGK
jgi:putative intracellular protease/amidase